MNTLKEIDNQQPSIRSADEGSETIPNGSRKEISEAVHILPGKPADEDMVQNKCILNFLEKANKKFNNRFSYFKFNYINAKTKGIIVCPTHGDFLQSPDKHLNSKYGCPECWNTERKAYSINWINSPKSSKTRINNKLQDFKLQCKNKYGNTFKYDYSTYKSFTYGTIKVTCKIHGESYQLPKNHLASETGCPKCGKLKGKTSKTLSYKNFLEKANIVHNNLYTYPNIKNLYNNRGSVIDIKCNIHGVFKKKAIKHLSGQGCNRCTIENLIRSNILVGGYSEKLFQEKPFLKNKKAFIYYISINGGAYYKIGITKKWANRKKGIISKAKKYNYIIKTIDVLQLVETTLYEAFIKEQDIINKNLKYRKITKWSTELFSKDLNITLGKHLPTNTIHEMYTDSQ